MERYINNIDYKNKVSLKDLIPIKDISVLSLVDRKSLVMKIISSDKNMNIPPHSSTGDALIIMLEGKAEITIEEEKFKLLLGESILIPANTEHSLYALESFKILVIQVKAQ